VSGLVRTDKTTALTQLGKTLEAIHRRRYPRCVDDIPVVYIIGFTIGDPNCAAASPGSTSSCAAPS
jgi:hypothetical protein